MKTLKKIMVGFVLLIVVLCITVFLFMQQAVFGKDPSGRQWERILKSPNFKDGKFQNLHETQMLAPDASFRKMLTQYLFTKPSNTG
jgi:hypothetical protein